MPFCKHVQSAHPCVIYNNVYLCIFFNLYWVDLFAVSGATHRLRPKCDFLRSCPGGDVEHESISCLEGDKNFKLIKKILREKLNLFFIHK